MLGLEYAVPATELELARLLESEAWDTELERTVGPCALVEELDTVLLGPEELDRVEESLTAELWLDEEGVLGAWESTSSHRPWAIAAV